MVILGFFYVVEGAEFLGIVQVFVYTGAVMMLFLFVLMLVGVDSSDSLVETIKGQRWVGLLLGLGLGILLIGAIGDFSVGTPRGLTTANADGNVTGLATLIFGKYVWAFEVTSALLITAALGAMVLAHRERLTEKVTQRDGVRAPVRRARALPGRPAGARCLRPAQRGRHPGPAAGRHAGRDVGLPGAHRPGPGRELGGLRGGDRRDRARGRGGQPAMSLTNYIYLATILFAIGATTVLLRRNAIIVFMGVELMLNATNLAFVTFARIQGKLDGQVIALFVMVVAAAEVVVGLAIVLTIFRARRSVSVDDADLLKL